MCLPFSFDTRVQALYLTGCLEKCLSRAPGDVPAGVAGQGVQPQQCRVHDQDQRAQAHVAPLAAGFLNATTASAVRIS